MIQFTFDKSAAKVVMKWFKAKKCCFCGKKLTARNYAGCVKGSGNFCDNFCCIVDSAMVIKGFKDLASKKTRKKKGGEQ